jgi:hypothetical protein
VDFSGCGGGSLRAVPRETERVSQVLQKTGIVPCGGYCSSNRADIGRELARVGGPADARAGLPIRERVTATRLPRASRARTAA